jgi:hypothetical protein
MMNHILVNIKMKLETFLEPRNTKMMMVTKIIQKVDNLSAVDFMDSVKLIIREAINTLECLKMAKEVASEI